ncbi:MAG: PTS system mannose/fructose/sorbose family transporter subunit IID [Erysipelothrix sp.]|nr:PTS system mannose/fructose/sorbose family transporter subunit IID [Erysipelothrix sp.]
MTKKISEKTLRKSWKIWFFWHGSSQQGENLLGNAMGHTMTPVIEELYDNKEEKVLAYKRSLTLFNTEQQLGAIAPGILVGVEESVANKEITPEIADSVKVALIGPTSAIGDSLWVATVIPLLLTVAMTITHMGGAFVYIGPLLYAIGYPIGTAIMSWKLWQLGYRTGIDSMRKFMESGMLEQITKTMTILGLIVVGALAASFVSVNIPLVITPPGGETAAVDVNAMINNIFPNILPLLFTIFVYWLYSKKNKSPLFIMGVILLVAILLTVVGVLSGTYVF